MYSFVAAPADMPANSSISGQMSSPSTPPTAEQIETGRKYGAQIAQQLVADIQAMGLPAAQAGPGSVPQVGDGVIRGYIVSAQGGGRGQAFRHRIRRGNYRDGYGGRGLRGDAAGLVQTRLRDARTSSGGKTPGIVVPAAVAIATANPIGLIVVGGYKIDGEASGRTRTRRSSQGDRRRNSDSTQD